MEKSLPLDAITGRSPYEVTFDSVVLKLILNEAVVAEVSQVNEVGGQAVRLGGSARRSPAVLPFNAHFFCFFVFF